MMTVQERLDLRLRLVYYNLPWAAIVEVPDDQLKFYLDTARLGANEEGKIASAVVARTMREVRDQMDLESSERLMAATERLQALEAAENVVKMPAPPVE